MSMSNEELDRMLRDEGFVPTVPEAVTTPVPHALLPPAKVTPPPTVGPMRATVSDGTLNKDGTVKRKRGRPPGSRNRPKDGEEPIRGARSTMVPPPARAIPTPDQEAANKTEREGKTARLEAWFTGEVSEDILSVVIAATGIPNELIFKQGKAPTRFAQNENLTPIGNAFAIPPDVAHYWAKVLVAAGETETGKKITGSVENGNAGLLMAALMAIASTVRWGQQLKGAMSQLQEFAEQQKQYAEQQAREAAQK